jgi:hypothetical protein
MGALALTPRERHILSLVVRRKKVVKHKWTVDGFDPSNAFIMATGKRLLAQCTRRSGKSYAAGVRLIKAAYETPGVNVLYIALTRDSAKRIMAKDILTQVLRAKKIGYKENKSDLTFTLDNGSVIYLVGADNSEKEMHKLLGSKYKEVVIDEAAFYTQNLEYLVEEVADAAVTDLDGTICMISTPGHNTYSYYCGAATKKIKGWDIHKWSAYENPFLIKNWDKKIKAKIKRDPSVVNTPSYRRMFLNEWAIDEDLQVYRFQDCKLVKELPDLPKVRGAKWHYGLGIDLGWNDDTSFVVGAWNRYSDVLYIVYKFKKKEMDFLQVGKYIVELEEYYGSFDFKVIDGASKQGVQTMVNKFKLNLVTAEKMGKRDHIELFNAELIGGRIQVVTEIENLKLEVGKQIDDVLLAEWANLVWDEAKKAKGVYQELASCENHVSDGCLYLWVHAFAHTSISLPPEEARTDSEEYLLEYVRKEEAAIEVTNRGGYVDEGYEDLYSNDDEDLY